MKNDIRDICKPLDKHIEIVVKKFPKYVPIEETENNCFPMSGILFKKEYYNEYAFLEVDRGSGTVSLTLFQSDWKQFEKIANDFVDGHVTFAVSTEGDTKTIINCLV